MRGVRTDSRAKAEVARLVLCMGVHKYLWTPPVAHAYREWYAKRGGRLKVSSPPHTPFAPAKVSSFPFATVGPGVDAKVCTSQPRLQRRRALSCRPNVAGSPRGNGGSRPVSPTWLVAQAVRLVPVMLPTRKIRTVICLTDVPSRQRYSPPPHYHLPQHNSASVETACSGGRAVVRSDSVGEHHVSQTGFTSLG